MPVLFFDRLRYSNALRNLARRNVFVGTSSWKYPGWCGMIYEEGRYAARGRFSRSRFESACLAEYSEVFPTVCVDAAYYKFPERHSIEQMVSLVPADFLFGLKVTDEITICRYPDLPRFAAQRGKLNQNFLHAGLFQESFLSVCDPFKKNIGLLIFEFSRLEPADFPVPGDFFEVLDAFLRKLPPDWPYAVEIRNPEFLVPEYFALLESHNIAHIYNSWAEMPPVSDQWRLKQPSNDLRYTGARFLLKPGRKYQEAVDLFTPYDTVKEPCDEAREAAVQVIRNGLANPKRRTFVFINNRLEGSAPLTIQAILERAGAEGAS